MSLYNNVEILEGERVRVTTFRDINQLKFVESTLTEWFPHF